MLLSTEVLTCLSIKLQCKPSYFIQSCLYLCWRRVFVSAAYLRISVQRQDLLFGVDQLAGVGDVNGRLLFVAGQHPDLQAGLPQGSYSFGNPVLQPVLDARCSCRSEKHDSCVSFYLWLRNRNSVCFQTQNENRVLELKKKKSPKRWRFVSSRSADSKSSSSRPWMAVSASR